MVPHIAISRYVPAAPPRRPRFAERLRRIMVTGVAVTFPFLVTLIVLWFVANFVSDVMEPFVGVLTFVGVASGGDGLFAHVVAVSGIVGFVFVTGAIAERNPDNRVGHAVEGLVEGIPGVGTVYTSFNRMSEGLLRSDAGSFREVKLVEFPHDEVYTLAFLTAAAPASVEAAAREERMRVLFVPLAPNPVMGGHLVCVPEDRIRDVDMTVQEAFQAIITSGVAAGSPAP